MMSSHRLLLLLPLTDRIFYEGEEGGGVFRGVSPALSSMMSWQ